MQLNTRLFLFVGLLLLIICLIVYLVPVYVVRKHAESDRERFVRRTVEERIDDQKHYAAWVQEEVASAKAAIDAFLFLTAGHRDIQLTLRRGGKTLGRNIWLQAARLLAFSDTIDFMQVSRLGGPTATLTLGNAKLYQAAQYPAEGDLVWVVLTQREDQQQEAKAYLGVWLPRPPVTGQTTGDEKPEKDAPEIFLLFDAAKLIRDEGKYFMLAKSKEDLDKALGEDVSPYVKQLSVALISRLAGAEVYLAKTFGQSLPESLEKLQKYTDDLEERTTAARAIAPLAPAEMLLAEATPKSTFLQLGASPLKTAAALPEEVAERAFTKRLQKEVRRVSDLEMIGALGFLASIGIISDSPFEEWVPSGAATLMLDKARGTAVLSSEVFSDKPDFDSVAFFEEYPPKLKGLPIGSAFGLFEQGEDGPLTVANAMVVEPQVLGPDMETAAGHLVLGASLNGILSTLSEISGQSAFLIYKDRLVGKAVIPGEDLQAEVIEQLLARHDQLSNHGFVRLGGKNWYYLRYQPDVTWDMEFVTLEPAEAVLAASQEFIRRSHEITAEFTKHIIFVALGVFVLSLIILELLGRHFTKPITMLAKATEKISAGQFEKVELPKFRRRSKNEISILTRAFSEMVDGLIERERLRGVLDKVVSKEIADEILKGNVSLGGDLREATVLFNDIRGFTHITEELPPEKVINMLNSYMTEMSEIIEVHQGVIDKYVGDEIMAIFGAPVPHKFNPLQAVLSALLMRQRLIEWNERRKAEGKMPLVSGTGIHTGPMIAGNMGAENRLNYTVLGANVNKASRLCDEARGMEILISQEMVDKPQIADTIEVEERPPLMLKGFSQPVPAYRVLGLKQQSLLGELSRFAKRFGPRSDEKPESPLLDS